MAAPGFVSSLEGLTVDKRTKILEFVHPEYDLRSPSWRVLLDAMEGSGGFLTGEYLWPFDRESKSHFNERKDTARYHNYIETLIDLYVRFVFTQGVTRTSTSKEYLQWITDVDGAGLSMDGFMRRLAAHGLAAGHAGALLDKTTDEPTGPTKADERARPYLTLFAATDIPDWRYAQNALSVVKLYEAVEDQDITHEAQESDEAFRYLIWARDGWARWSSDGDLLNKSSDGGLGVVPLTIFRPRPSHKSPMFGRPLVANANIVKAMFNRCSEEDTVLREQAFSLLTVSVHPEIDINQAREQLGNEVGTARAVVIHGDLDYKTPDQSVPEALRANIQHLVQELFRAAHLRVRRDGLQTESGESIRLQYAELNEALQGFASELAETEKRIARDWFIWQSSTMEQGLRAYESAKVEVQYPDEFFNEVLQDELLAWGEAIRMNLGPTMRKRIKKKAVRRIDPNIPEEELADIDKEIDGQPDDIQQAQDLMRADLGPNANPDEDETEERE